MDRAAQARRILLAVFLAWCVVLSAAFLHSAANFVAVQNTQASVRAHPTNLTWTFNQTEAVFSVKILVENGGRLDIRIYEIPTQLLIFNRSTSEEFVEVAEGNARTELRAGQSAELVMKMKMRLENPSEAVKEALRHIKLGVPGVSRDWLVLGRVLFYVDPFGVRGEQQVCSGDLGRCVM